MATIRRGADPVFNGARLRLARHFAGLPLAELGDRVEVTPAFLSYLESGHRKPGSLLVEALAECLGVLPEFFFQKSPEEFRDEECFFRKRQTTPVSARTQVLAHATLFAAMVSHMETYLDLPEHAISPVRARTAEEIERAAERCRMDLGIGLDTPIENVMCAVENVGVPITTFESLSEKVDAFSRFGNRSVVVFRHKTPCRSRWDVAHEWGHLMIHAGARADDDEIEREADRFAGAMLLPRSGFAREFPRVGKRWDWESMFRLKDRWHVSLAAIVRRAYELNLVSAAHYRSAYKYMSWKGWLRGEEPYEPEPEKPELIKIACDALESDLGIPRSQLASELCLTAHSFERVCGLPIEDSSPTTEARGEVVFLAQRRRKKRKGARK